MNRIIEQHAGRPDRPLVVRAAHKWYAWIGVALTVAGAYFAGNGQLRIGDGAPLRAAPTDSVNWKPTPAPTTTDTPKSPSPVEAPSDPFKAAPVPVAEKTAPAPEIVVPKNDAGPALVDPFKAPPEAKPALDKKVEAVLDAYLKDKDVVPAKTVEPKETPKITVPPVLTPPAPKSIFDPPADSGPSLPTFTPAPVKPEAPAHAKPETPAPGVPAPLPPLGTGVKLPSIPAPPVVKTSEGPEPGNLVVQEPETFPIPPKPVERSAEKKEPAPKRTPIFGKLSQEDEIKLNAAQNAARLRDFNRAAALMADIIARNPEEYGLRAEFAGILLSAGDAPRAIKELEEVIRRAPNVAGYRLLLGDAYMGARNFRAAAEVYMSTFELIGQDPRLAERQPEVVIRAARAYALDQDFFRAAFLVDKYLSTIKPDDPRAPLAMGAILLDLDRPYDAMPYLIEKRKQLLASPEATDEYELKLLEVLASMVRGFARVGDRKQAMDAIQEMAPRAPKQLAIRVTLADMLAELNEHELAGHVYNQVLAVDPVNGGGLIGIARVYLETYQPTMAKKVLDSFVPSPAFQRDYLMTYSSYHQSIGEYTEAKQIYKDMLRRNDNDHEVRYAIGRLYEYTSEWEKAKGEFAKIPPQDKMARRARLWFGYALLHQRKFAEAAQVAAQFMQDDPNNPEGVALHVRALAKLGQFDRAVQAGRGYLTVNQRDERSAIIVRLAIARALLEANRNLDAAREYEIALSKPAGRVPESYYGLARAAERLGNADRATQIIGTLCGAVGGDVRNRLLLADFYSQDFEDAKVIEIINSFVGYDNNNLAILIRLADAQQRASRWPGDPADAFATCQTIIQQSPTNVRGHLAMARSFAVTQNYRKASVQYDQLIAIDPEFTIPPRERARILYSDKQFSAARSQYNVMLSPSPEELVLGQMAYHAQRDARLRQVFGPYLGGHMNGPGLRAELARLASSCPDEEARLAAHRLICDYDATIAWQEAFRLERDAKELKDYRNYMAVPQYNALHQFEPSNSEATFDQGQVYGGIAKFPSVVPAGQISGQLGAGGVALGQVWGPVARTRAALTWYNKTLEVDPTHRDASVASERASANISPRADLRADYFSQKGRTGLAEIKRQRYLADVGLPLGDEGEFLYAGYQRMAMQPRNGDWVWGSAPFVRGQYGFDDMRGLGYAQVNVEEWEQGGFKTRPTFDAGYWYDHNDVFRTRGGAFLENVAENGESVRQDIYRYGLYCGLDVRPTRTWAFGGMGTYAHYSDDNDACFGFLWNEVSLTLPPKQLKLVQRFNVFGFREETRFPTEPPSADNLFGTVHPYFSPDSFCTLECRIEWWHWLSRDYFTHSNQCWYSLQYGIATDNNQVTYHNFRAIVYYDINSCLTIGAEASSTVSSQYDMFGAMAFLQVRLLGP